MNILEKKKILDDNIFIYLFAFPKRENGKIRIKISQNTGNKYVYT